MASISPNVNELEQHLQKIIRRDITLPEDEVKETNHSLQSVLLGKMQEEMKRIDETFKVLYKQPHYVGSFYENLRVGQPTEFDINLELQLPLSDTEIEIDTCSTEPGFSKIKVGSKFNSTTPESVKKKIELWLVNRYLCRNKVIQWLQGIVDKVLKIVQWPDDYMVRMKTSGPAVTLNVRIQNNNEFDVDLVPVFMFGRSKCPLSQLEDIPRPVSSQKWCVVPKAPRQESTSILQWRMSFYAFEKEIMNGLYNMKPVVKLFKLLRDKQKWNGLSSYYIKTIFMWEQHYNKYKPDFWRNGLGYLFMHMLNKLESFLQAERIPFFWDDQSNLIEHLNSAEITNICGRVTRIKRKLNNALMSPDSLSSVVENIFKEPTRQRSNEQNGEELQQQQSWVQQQQSGVQQQQSWVQLQQSRAQQQQSGAGLWFIGLTGAAILSIGAGMLMAWRNGRNND